MHPKNIKLKANKLVYRGGIVTDPTRAAGSGVPARQCATGGPVLVVPSSSVRLRAPKLRLVARSLLGRPRDGGPVDVVHPRVRVGVLGNHLEGGGCGRGSFQAGKEKLAPKPPSRQRDTFISHAAEFARARTWCLRAAWFWR